jgi:hypothetical protein
LSQDEVTVLVRGQMAEEHIARILGAKPVPLGPPVDRGRKAKRGPVDLAEADLAAVSVGAIPEKLRSRLEKAAAGDRLKAVRRRKGKPRLRPAR